MNLLQVEVLLQATVSNGIKAAVAATPKSTTYYDGVPTIYQSFGAFPAVLTENDLRVINMAQKPLDRDQYTFVVK